MNTRIRYKNTGSRLQSDDIVCNGVVVHAIIDSSTLVYELTNGNKVLGNGQGKNLADCKKRVKNDLRLLGASFSSEIRNRGNIHKL